jgi:hypothetical protein
MTASLPPNFLPVPLQAVPVSDMRIDDSDPAVAYSGQWFNMSRIGSFDTSTYFNGSLHGSFAVNDKATLIFQGKSALLKHINDLLLNLFT